MTMHEQTTILEQSTPRPDQAPISFDDQLLHIKEQVTGDNVPSAEIVLQAQELLRKVNKFEIGGEEGLLDDAGNIVNKTLYEEVEKATSEENWFDPDKIDRDLRVKETTKYKDLTEEEDRKDFKDYWRTTHPEMNMSQAYALYRGRAEQRAEVTEKLSDYYDTQEAPVAVTAPEAPLAEPEAVAAPKGDKKPSPASMPGRTTLAAGGLARPQTTPKAAEAPKQPEQAAKAQPQPDNRKGDNKSRMDKDDLSARGGSHKRAEKKSEPAAPVKKRRQRGHRGDAAEAMQDKEENVDAASSLTADFEIKYPALATYLDKSDKAEVVQEQTAVESVVPEVATDPEETTETEPAAAQETQAEVTIEAQEEPVAVVGRRRRRAKRGVVHVEQAAAPDVISFEPAADNPHRVIVRSGPANTEPKRVVVTGGAVPAEYVAASAAQAASVASAHPAATPDTAPRLRGTVVGTARRSTETRGAGQGHPRYVNGITPEGINKIYEDAQTEYDQETQAPAGIRARVRSVFEKMRALPYTIPASLLALGDKLETGAAIDPRNRQETIRKRKLWMAAGVGAVAVANLGWNLYKAKNGFVTGGGINAAEYLPVSSGESGATIAPEVVTPVIPEGFGATEVAGDTIWEDSARLVEANGLDSSNTALVDAISDSVVAHDNMSVRDTETMQIGQTYGYSQDEIGQILKDAGAPTMDQPEVASEQLVAPEAAADSHMTEVPAMAMDVQGNPVTPAEYEAAARADQLEAERNREISNNASLAAFLGAFVVSNQVAYQGLRRAEDERLARMAAQEADDDDENEDGTTAKKKG